MKKTLAFILMGLAAFVAACLPVQEVPASENCGVSGNELEFAPDGSLADVPEGFAPGKWVAAGDIKAARTPNGVLLRDGIIYDGGQYGDAEYDFRFRAPENAGELQAWMSFRVKDRHNRYTVGLRGGNNNMLYMARYADDANSRFLGFAPLEFAPEKGRWYDLKVVTVGKVIQVYLNGEDKPRLVIEDDTALWTDGGIGVGESYMPTEFSVAKVRPIGADEAKELAKTKKPKQAYEPWKPSADKAKKREENRAAYKPFVLKDISAPRTEFSLDGEWLFMPSQDLPKDAKPLALDYNDSAWHTLNVPDMWVPPLAWLHGETGFPYLEEPARGKSAADKLRISEIKRVLGLTFDWDATKSAWYRNYIDLPEDVAGKHFELKFDAIATISRIFVNGEQVGSHVGMFGEIVCDITKQVRPGRNVVAVEVIREVPKAKKSGDVIEVAVTVEITEDMVNSLPKAFYTFSPAGIWQPVKLVVTNPVNVKDVFVKPALDGAEFDVTVANDGGSEETFDVSYTVAPTKERSILFSKKDAASVALKPGETKVVTLKPPKLEPKLWSPAEPNLYYVDFTLSKDGKPVDSYRQTFGFRTIGVEGNRIMLNGKPFWLRGANHFPHAARANDRELAHKYLQLARDHNVAAGRLHVGPVTEAWAEAADDVGFIFSVEGIWPWLMLKKGNIPSDELLNAWRSDWASIVKKYRNHPGIGLWTVNNEMKFYIFERGEKDILLKKWKIVDDMVRTMRKIDPTRPIVADSGYVRNEGNMKDYNEIVKPNNIDDGDIDDIHRYYGWYNESFFHYFDGQFKGLTLPDRPFISQEMSTGYCNEDDGLPSRVYLFNHYTPQALIGDYAFEHNNPKYFLERQSFMTKELGENFRRRHRDHVAGILHFGFVTWQKDSHFAGSLAPRVGMKNLKKMLSPVLVSMELFGRHFYGGREITRDMYIINDSEKFADLPETELLWKITADGRVLAEGSRKVGPVKYYTNLKFPLSIRLPDVVGKVDAKLSFTLKDGGGVVSENDYDIVIANENWAGRNTAADAGFHTDLAAFGAVYDPRGEYAGLLPPALKRGISGMSEIGNAKLLVIADLPEFFKDSANVAALEKFVKDGGRLLVLNGGKAFADWRKGEISLYRGFKSSRDGGEIVTPKVPESPVFSGINPMDTAWFADEGSRAVPMACTAVYQINRENPGVRELAESTQIHAYLQKPSDVLKYSGSPIVEIRDGKGLIIASEMRLKAAKDDPVARRLLSNMLDALLK